MLFPITLQLGRRASISTRIKRKKLLLKILKHKKPREAILLKK